ncbi:MAG: serine protease [Clostridiales bacterium]|nr:serine protease [Clostridiales bacterium]
MSAYKKNLLTRVILLAWAVLICLFPLLTATSCKSNLEDLTTTDTTTTTETTDLLTTAGTTESSTTTIPVETTAAPDTTENLPPPTITQKSTSPTPKVSETPSSIQDIEKQVAALVNQARRQNGLAELALSEELFNVAQIKADDMASNKYFSHTSPTYGSPFDMMQRFDINYRTAGENIAMGQRTAQQVFDGWMNSQGHRANILNPSFTKIGVGYTTNGHYWVQLFIG